jgi:Domain found in Dishevelled, Egl-10, and Pleckstrin (DEP)
VCVCVCVCIYCCTHYLYTHTHPHPYTRTRSPTPTHNTNKLTRYACWEGVERDTRSRNIFFKSYKDCVVGRDIVKWLLRVGKCRSESEALSVAQDLLSSGLLLHASASDRRHLPSAHFLPSEKHFYLFSVRAHTHTHTHTHTLTHSLTHSHSLLHSCTLAFSSLLSYTLSWVLMDTALCWTLHSVGLSLQLTLSWTISSNSLLHTYIHTNSLFCFSRLFTV